MHISFLRSFAYEEILKLGVCFQKWSFSYHVKSVDKTWSWKNIVCGRIYNACLDNCGVSVKGTHMNEPAHRQTKNFDVRSWWVILFASAPRCRDRQLYLYLEETELGLRITGRVSRQLPRFAYAWGQQIGRRGANIVVSDRNICRYPWKRQNVIQLLCWNI